MSYHKTVTDNISKYNMPDNATYMYVSFLDRLESDVFKVWYKTIVCMIVIDMTCITMHSYIFRNFFYDIPLDFYKIHIYFHCIRGCHSWSTFHWLTCLQKDYVISCNKKRINGTIRVEDFNICIILVGLNMLLISILRRTSY